MTALNFCIYPNAVYVVADTLVTHDYTPAFFTTKVFPVPHWNGVIGGTGSLGLIQDWLHVALSGVLAVDLIHLDQFVTESLQRLFAERPAEERENCTTTIYHFGFDFQEEVFKAFAYRSTSGFASEPLQYGLYRKPDVDMTDREVKAFPDDFVKMMRDQRTEQERVPLPERTFIGGQVIGWMMQRIDREGKPPSVVTTIEPAFEWEDFEVDFAKCIEALPPNA